MATASPMREHDGVQQPRPSPMRPRWPRAPASRGARAPSRGWRRPARRRTASGTRPAGPRGRSRVRRLIAGRSASTPRSTGRGSPRWSAGSMVTGSAGTCAKVRKTSGRIADRRAGKTNMLQRDVCLHGRAEEEVDERPGQRRSVRAVEDACELDLAIAAVQERSSWVRPLAGGPRSRPRPPGWRRRRRRGAGRPCPRPPRTTRSRRRPSSTRPGRRWRAAPPSSRARCGRRSRRTSRWWPAGTRGRATRRPDPRPRACPSRRAG